MFQTSTMKIGCNMQNLTRHVCKKKPSIGEKLKSDVFWPFFEGSKIENFVFSIDNVLPNLLNTPYNESLTHKDLANTDFSKTFSRYIIVDKTFLRNEQKIHASLRMMFSFGWFS